MSSYTEHDDAAWLDGAPAPVPEPTDIDYTGHPQLAAVEHAVEQLRAARHWSHVDPDVEAAYRAAVDALAEELHHHADNHNHHETEENTAMYETPITVIGNLTQDPELRFTPSGAAVASFTVASTPRTFDRQANEWKDGETLFLRGQVWRESAENVAESLSKGMRVIATGRLVSRTFETKEGDKRTVIELSCDEIGPSLRFASASVSRGQRSGQPAPAQGRPAGQQPDPWATPTGGQPQTWGSGPAAETEPPF